MFYCTIISWTWRNIIQFKTFVLCWCLFSTDFRFRLHFLCIILMSCQLIFIQMFYSDQWIKKIFQYALASLAVLIYTEPLVTQSASTIYAITRLALVSMRQMLEGIVWRMASTVLLLTGHMISDLQSMISGDIQSKYWPLPSLPNFSLTSCTVEQTSQPI